METISLSRKYEKKQSMENNKEEDKSNGFVSEITKPNSNSEELLEIKPIDGTPFNAVRLEDKWFLAMGKYRLSEPYEREDHVLEDAKSASWERIMQIVNIMIKEHEATKTK